MTTNPPETVLPAGTEIVISCGGLLTTATLNKAATVTEVDRYVANRGVKFVGIPGQADRPAR